MTLARIRFVLYNIRNKITGKQDVIDEYNMLVGFLNNITNMDHIPVELRQQISEQLKKITESEPIYGGHATVMYSPFYGARRTTINKISRLYDIKTRAVAKYDDIQKNWEIFCNKYQR